MWAFSQEHLEGAPAWAWGAAGTAAAVYAGFLLYVAVSLRRGPPAAAEEAGAAAAGSGLRAPLLVPQAAGAAAELA